MSASLEPGSLIARPIGAWAVAATYEEERMRSDRLRIAEDVDLIMTPDSLIIAGAVCVSEMSVMVRGRDL